MEKITFKGSPLTLIGRELKIGDNAPEFNVLSNDMKEIHLAEFRGKILLLNVVTSLDTPICDEQTKKFNSEAASLPHVQILTISVDLPFAQSRFCGGNDMHIKVASDHKDVNFGMNYGVLIKEWRMLARSIFLVDQQGKVRYKEIVPEVASHPNYNKVLEEIKKL